MIKALPVLAVVTAAGAGAGLLYAILSESPSLIAGMIYGAAIGLTVSLFERGVVFGSAQERMRRWPTFVYVTVTELACVALVCIGFAIGGAVSWSLGLIPTGFRDSTVAEPRVIAYGFLVSAMLIFTTRMRDLLGHAVFSNFLIGRYHRPVAEERIFLFLDLAGSTAYARQHGDLRAQEYLGAIFAALAAPISAHGGAIDDYIGDMAMVTWPFARGARNADCVRCLFAILDRFASDEGGWLARFGAVPRFHAALHGGSVVTAEIGVDRHKISYFGDVVNTTARLEQLCRELGAPVLISGALLARLPTLPAGVAAKTRGPHALKGSKMAIEVVQLLREGAARVGAGSPRLQTA